MESLEHIKGRLNAVKNVGQITKAMEVVSATKMRKAQEVALRSRPYAYRALELLQVLVEQGHASIPFTESRVVKNTLVVIVASDRGLAGSFNAQVMRLVDAFLERDGRAMVDGHHYMAMTVGSRSAAFAHKKHLAIVEEYSKLGDAVSVERTLPIAKKIVEGYEAGRWDRVVVISTHFRSTLKQEVLERQVMPLDVEKVRETVNEIVPELGRFSNTESLKPKTYNLTPSEYIFEPSADEALRVLVPHLIAMELYHTILEANASEHSARMVAMKTASDNARDLSGELLLQYNKARQAGITEEIIEIISTINAIAN